MKDGRGFAPLDPAKRREIASRGGKAAHAKGTALRGEDYDALAKQVEDAVRALAA